MEIFLDILSSKVLCNENLFSIKGNFSLQDWFKISSLFCLSMWVTQVDTETRQGPGCVMFFMPRSRQNLDQIDFCRPKGEKMEKSILFRARGHFFAILRKITLREGKFQIEENHVQCVNLFLLYVQLLLLLLLELMLLLWW